MSMYPLLVHRPSKPVLTMRPRPIKGEKFRCSSHSNVAITGYTWYLPFRDTPYMTASSTLYVSNSHVGRYSCTANINGVNSQLSNVIVGKSIPKTEVIVTGTPTSCLIHYASFGTLHIRLVHVVYLYLYQLGVFTTILTRSSSSPN